MTWSTTDLLKALTHVGLGLTAGNKSQRRVSKFTTADQVAAEAEAQAEQWEQRGYALDETVQG